MRALNTDSIKSIINWDTIMALIDEAIKELMYGFADEATFVIPDSTSPSTALAFQEALRTQGFIVDCCGTAFTISVPETPNESSRLTEYTHACEVQDVRLALSEFDWYQNIIDNMTNKSGTVMFSDLQTIGPKQRGDLGIVLASKHQKYGFVWFMEKNGFEVETLDDRFIITYVG